MNTQYLKNGNTLSSGLYTYNRPFSTKHPCKIKTNHSDKIDNCERIYFKSYNLSIVKHNNKNKVKPVKSIISDKQNFKYFENHKNCRETQYLWHDILKPKILRHYSKDKKMRK
jgi:hypothetical protein